MSRKSIAVPIILILLAIASGILFAGHSISRHVVYKVFEERESNNAKRTHMTIESMLAREEKRITSLAKVLKRDTDISYGLYHYQLTGGDIRPLKSVMDQLYSQMNLQVFVMADSRGNVLYRADKVRERENLRSFDAFARALKGEQVVTASRGPDGWGVRAIVPLYEFKKKILSGVLILGNRINDDYAKNIARETGSQVFLATGDGVIAQSYAQPGSSPVDLSLVKGVLSDRKPVFHTDRNKFLSYTYVPLTIIDRNLCLVIENDISVVEELLDQNKVEMAQWGTIIFLGITLIGVALTVSLIYPLNRLQEKARRVIKEYSGNDSGVLPRGNEISTLVHAFNLMVDTIKEHLSKRTKAEEQLRQSQKMEAIGKLAGGVAHDFNNLLSVITGYSELLLNRLGRGSPGIREIEEIHKAGERAAALTQQLLAFSRRQVLMPKILQLNELVSSLGKMLRRLIGENIELATILDPDLRPVRADPVQIDQILINLAVNARDAMPRGGKLSLSTRNVALDAPLGEANWNVPVGMYVTLEIADTGCGMDPETMSRIFEPFFTTKEQGKGTGLGLATVYGIVKQSGGYIRVRSEPGSGTTFTVYLPAAEGVELPEEPGDAGEENLAGRETILVVEDEEMVRTLVCDTLREFGYDILEAPGGEEAVAVSLRHEETIDLLITDVVMPRMNGLELARRIKASRPGIPVLFMSGYSEEGVMHLGVIGPGEAFLQKPITPSRLSAKVREVLSEREAVSPA
jgi:signal transduction histidine kinase